MTREERVLRVLEQFEWHQYAPFETGILNFYEELRAMCAMNSCGRYGKTWNCPPVVGSLEELIEVCRSYQRGILFNIVTHIEDSYDFDGMMKGSAVLSKKLRATDLALQAEFGDTLEYRIFGSGSCAGCDECTYPERPCRTPEYLFTPIEACGINVSSLAKLVGMNYINGQNTVTYFGMVLF
jgi:predicted metal-binding protein